jgi:hypothetical protein
VTEGLIRLVDDLEDRAESYLTMDDVWAVADPDEVATAIAEHVLLVDHRTREDGSAVTLCRLNRRHPRVAKLTGWS